MIKKINLKIILLEILALFFFINGIQRLYVTSQGEKYQAIFTDNWDKFESLTSLSPGEFTLYRAYWAFGAFIVGSILIGIVNRRNKISVINLVIILIVMFLLFTAGLFTNSLINIYMNSFGGLFSDSFATSNLIGGVVFTLISIVLFWKVIQPKIDNMHA